jgi:purine-nucleoside phosphorylase
MSLGFEQVQSAAAFVRDRVGDPAPTLGLVLGSGLGAFADSLESPVAVPYNSVPHFPVSTVEGHRGRLVVGNLGGRRVIVMQGRVHLYEGYDPSEVVFGVRVMATVGVKSMVLTNAAGAIHPSFRVGDLMILTDHLNLTGRSPLAGPNDARLGPRFPDMSDLYRASLRDLAKAAGAAAKVPLKEGVYAGLNGPQYETPAEIRMFRTLGADAVGMSTVHEAIAAGHMGVGVVGMSCLTNLAAGLSPSALSHAEVKVAADEAAGRMEAFLRELCARLP